MSFFSCPLADDQYVTWPALKHFPDSERNDNVLLYWYFISLHRERDCFTNNARLKNDLEFLGLSAPGKSGHRPSAPLGFCSGQYKASKMNIFQILASLLAVLNVQDTQVYVACCLCLALGKLFEPLCTSCWCQK